MSNDLRAMAVSCRKAATTLRAEMPKATRAAILTAMARLLVENEVRILAANEEDLIEATKSGVDQNLVSRLKLTPAKIDVLARGIIQLAGQTDPLGEVLRRTEVSPGLNLEQIRVPLGVLLVIFEARPDALPQIAALSIFSGNGLILKGGKEAARSNAVLHSIVSEAIAEVTSGQVPTSLVSLVTSRDEISALLELDDVIDLVIPRGSGSLVKHIQQNTRIPVMGHSEGICHVYLDAAADKTEAINISVDAKINYPAACNAAETVLIHDDLVSNGTAGAVASALAAAGVKIWAGPRVTAAISSGAAGTDSIAPHIAGPVKTFKHEYGDLEISFETVESMTAAIDHIATYGSRHTESIVTENNETAAAFMATVDAACVFHNASTRFADGFRFGLGAEVGISTSPIHARGPVGVEGLTSTKWLLNSDRGHTVGAFASGEFEYTHKKLPINQ